MFLSWSSLAELCSWCQLGLQLGERGFDLNWRSISPRLPSMQMVGYDGVFAAKESKTVWQFVYSKKCFLVVEESMKVSCFMYIEADYVQLELTILQNDLCFLIPQLFNLTANSPVCLFKLEQQLVCFDQAFCPLPWILLRFFDLLFYFFFLILTILCACPNGEHY